MARYDKRNFFFQEINTTTIRRTSRYHFHLHRYSPNSFITKAWYDKKNGMFHYELTKAVESGKEEEEQ
jgi:hypothetical protein